MKMILLDVLIFFTIFHQIQCDWNDLKPILRELSLPRNLQEGKAIQIHCLLDNPSDSPVNFEWHFNGLKLDNQNENIHIVTKEDTSALKIKNLTLDNIGSYACLVSNQFGSDEQRVDVLFNVKPRWIEEPTDKLTKSLGEKVEINCSMSGNPKPIIYWSKIDVNTGAIEQRFESSILRINVDNKTEGKYKCTGRNEVGSLERIIHIRYKGKV